ncbi:MAG: glycosyltransferase family A protein [Acidobacteriota bacterium]
MESPETEKRAESFAVVPSYNHAPFVEKCLRSIIDQTLPPKKLLVIDDGSTDGSPAIIERVLAECPFDSELIARENRGLSTTLNEAFALSHGEFFAYLGSDDLWLPDFLDEQTRLLSSRPNAVLAFAHAYVIDERNRIIDSTDKWTDFADGDMLPQLLNGVVFSSPGVLYRRTALIQHRWNETARLEDYEMYLKLAPDGEFARNERLLCAWRRHSVNASLDLPRMFPEMIAAQDRLADRLGISNGELKKSQTKMKFAAAANFVRHGFRREAGLMFIENWRGADSIRDLLGTALRIAVPETIFKWNRARTMERDAERFGEIDDMIDPR